MLLSKYGEVGSVHIFRDRETEEPLGYASVEMPDDDDAEFAIKRHNLQSANGVRAEAAMMIDDSTFSAAQGFGLASEESHI